MSEPAATVRHATGADLPRIWALLDRYFTEWDIWERDLPAAVLTAMQYPGLGFFIAEAEGEPAGCVLCRPLPLIEGAVECKRLFVAPEFRGRAIAGLLMDAAESAARDAGRQWIYLDSKAEFATAIALYRSRGYAECPRFNDNAQATVFMRKPLREAPIQSESPRSGSKPH